MTVLDLIRNQKPCCRSLTSSPVTKRLRQQFLSRGRPSQRFCFFAPRPNLNGAVVAYHCQPFSIRKPCCRRNRRLTLKLPTNLKCLSIEPLDPSNRFVTLGVGSVLKGQHFSVCRKTAVQSFKLSHPLPIRNISYLSPVSSPKIIVVVRRVCYERRTTWQKLNMANSRTTVSADFLSPAQSTRF